MRENNYCWRLVRCLCPAALVLLLQFAGPLSLTADVIREQTIQLQRGWNAVFLEVYPKESKPEVLFADTPVDMAASVFKPVSSAQFITDPGADMFKVAHWGVWYAANRPDAFLKTLYSIYGQQAYLIHSQSDFTWNVEGTVVMAQVRWQPDAYNFVGFSVHAQAAPTFAQFFGGSTAHRQDRIYRLADGTWRRVSNPDAEMMRSGEAFWIYCEGASKYQGPLHVETRTHKGLLLFSEAQALTLRNQTDHPVTPTVEHVVTGANSVPLSIVIRALGDETSSILSVAAPQPAGAWIQPMPPLEARQAIRVPLEARHSEMNDYLQASLLKISTDLGTEVWIPVFGVREDLKDQ